MSLVNNADTLPTELVNLLALHSAFLTALSLYFAHHGTASPVDLGTLIDSVTRVWRQRQVTFNDIRLCVGVLNHAPTGMNNPFYLSDYGRGKICLELHDTYKMTAGASMNEEARL